ncbi:MAG TPA: tail fiber domain-containing protein, partial [Flavobacteriales bacterium]|nr:tail fiber domain-containing protein [Flavobacteriales bacterium]
MRLTPTLVNQNWGWYQTGNLDFSGHLGIGSPAPNPPLTYLHIYSGFTGVTPGYRPWMRVGTYATQDSDGLYIGMRPINGLTHSILSWSDDFTANQGQGPDPMCFVFTSQPDNTTVANTFAGLEIARMLPAANGNEGYLGIGDYFTAGLNPTQRLDVLDGFARIRQLPTDPISTSTDMVVVRADGVLEHRPMPTTGLADCDWSTDPGPQNNVSTAFGAVDPNCPDANDAVGIGLNLGGALATSKMTIASTNFARGLDVTASNANGFVIGGRFSALGTSNSGTRGIQVFSNGAGAGAVGRAADFISNDNSFYTNGVHAETFGGTFQAAAVYGWCHSTATNNIGLYGRVDATTATSWAGYFQGNVHVQGNITASGTVTWSDESIKTDVQEITDPMEIIRQLRPTTYQFLTDQNPYMNLPLGLQRGFIAQEVENVMPDVVHDIHIAPVLDQETNEVMADAQVIKGINYTAIIPVVVAGMQEQDAKVAVLEAQLAEAQTTNATLNDQVQHLTDRLDAMDQNIASCCAIHSDQRSTSGEELIDEKLNGANDRLLHIAPNPFETQTTIYYQLEQGGRMQLMANSADGKQLRVLHEANMEQGSYQFNWNTADLALGIYYVTLLLDGKP